MKRLARLLGGSRILLVGVVLLCLFALVALLAPLIAPYDPKAISGGALEGPSWAHLLGTNDAGSDNLSRLLWGARTSMLVAVVATTTILIVGVAVGAAAGLRGGIIDTGLMRIVDVFLAVPVLPVVIFIAALAGPSLPLTIFMIALFAWAEPARIVRSQTLTLRTRGYVDCARGFGAGPTYVIRRHLVPALGPVIAAQMLYIAGTVVVIEAALGFIGLADPSAVSWGADINRAMGNQQIAIGWLWVWWLLPLGAAIVLALLGFSLVGVGLEPEFNPRVDRATTGESR